MITAVLGLDLVAELMMLQEIKNLVETELDFTLEGFGRVEGVVGSEDDIGIGQQIDNDSGLF